MSSVGASNYPQQTLVTQAARPSNQYPYHPSNSQPYLADIHFCCRSFNKRNRMNREV